MHYLDAEVCFMCYTSALDSIDLGYNVGNLWEL